MNGALRFFVGYDMRELAGYPVFCHSVLSRTREHVSFMPMRGVLRDGSNTSFDSTRWDVPRLCNYTGLAIWAECDMMFRADVAELLDLVSGCSFDVALVKHDYRTKHPIKFCGQRNEDYPRKNWSSFMLIDCGAAVWRRADELRRSGVLSASNMHRFPEHAAGLKLFDQERILALDPLWNHLVSEYPYDPAAKMAHFTIGLPCFPEYKHCAYSDEWHRELSGALGHIKW